MEYVVLSTKEMRNFHQENPTINIDRMLSI